MTRILILLFAGLVALTAAEPLRVCATTTDLGDLARIIGGADVEVTTFARGGDDPHFVEARPSFTKALARADLLVVIGLELEIGWVPVLQEQARNPRVLTGGPGYIDASSVIPKLGVPAHDTTRAHGDVHAGGNPHYLADPANGLRVARLLADRLIGLAPERRERIEHNWEAFAKRLAIALFGDERGASMVAGEVVALIERETTQPSAGVGGWFGRLRAHAGTTVVTDHDLWPYVARRFRFSIVAFLEPKPGISPTTSHLTKVMEQMNAGRVRAILTSPYFDPRYARLVAGQTGAVIIPLAHQVGALPGTGDYLTTIGHNVAALEQGLAAATK
jgi:zinc/manganese transport system substrate-binding protein